MLRDYKRSLFESDVAEVSPSNVQFIAPLANPPLQLQPGAVLVPPALPAANALFSTAPKLQQSPFTQRAQSIDDTMMVSYNDQQYPPYRPSIPLNRRPSLPMPKPPPAFIQQPQSFNVVTSNSMPSMMPYPATVPNTLPLINFNQLVPRTNTNSIQSHNHYNSRISQITINTNILHYHHIYNSIL